jgi:hypothetical protein
MKSEFGKVKPEMTHQSLLHWKISLFLFHSSLFSCAQFAESHRLEESIRANLKGLGFQ